MEVRDQHQLQQIKISARDQQYIRDQLQQLNQRLDSSVTTLIICLSVESYSNGGQTIGSSHLPNFPELQVEVPMHQEQPQSGDSEERTGDRLQGTHRGPPTEFDIWTVIQSFKDSFNLFLKYLRVRLGVGIASHEVGSLLITVTCSSLQILEGLWEDYCSDHLNKVAEQKLVTAQVLEKLHLREVKLKTTIAKEEYQKCKKVF
ncbi:hypothetical protein OS493_028753 [Desmophyllum pertusum]|uniref:Uncharacterized protein n=1 Tax=Desmophyllum pertusum TaxID=174260 RepID=A0A9W9Y948_9CNID|nr:hypothetical protein OS493_028753 [Desmophyllum pertusum]